MSAKLADNRPIRMVNVYELDLPVKSDMLSDAYLNRMVEDLVAYRPPKDQKAKETELQKLKLPPKVNA